VAEEAEGAEAVSLLSKQTSSSHAREKCAGGVVQRRLQSYLLKQEDVNSSSKHLKDP